MVRVEAILPLSVICQSLGGYLLSLSAYGRCSLSGPVGLERQECLEPKWHQGSYYKYKRRSRHDTGTKVACSIWPMVDGSTNPKTPCCGHGSRSFKNATRETCKQSSGGSMPALIAPAGTSAKAQAQNGGTLRAPKTAYDVRPTRPKSQHI